MKFKFVEEIVVFCRIIYSNKDFEVILSVFYGWMKKKIMVYLYNRIEFFFKEEKMFVEIWVNLRGGIKCKSRYRKIYL